MAFIVHCYDLLIKNGTLVDPAHGIHKKMDIGIYGTQIADVFEPGTMDGKICGQQVIDAEGLVVVPGLVNGHAHVLDGLRFSYNPKELWKRGITALIDMGSQTSASFNRKRYAVDAIPCTVNVCLGLSSMSEVHGEIPRYTVLDQEVNKEKLKDLFEIHKDILIGMKVFVGHNDSPGADLTRAVMKKARETCDYIGCRMFVHVANPDLPMEELITYFNPGDNFTHTFNKGNILDENGNVRDCIWKAQEAGVLFDSARGSRNWSVEVAQKAFAQGFRPDVITDDLTALSNDPQTSRLHVHMGEFMALGMDFDDVLYKATNVPASYMKGVEVGVVKGNKANITILEMKEGPHTYKDAFGVETVGNCFITPRATIINGNIMYNTIETDF